MRCQHGATALIFAVALVPILIIAGAAVDYSRRSSWQPKLQNILDAAVLAGATLPTLQPNGDVTSADARKKYAQQLFDSSFSDHSFDEIRSLVKVDIEAKSSGTDLTGMLTASIPTNLINFIGIGSMQLNLTSEAAINQPNRQLDIVMCIDATGSMGPTIDAVRNNAEQLEQNINNELNQRNYESFGAIRARVIFYRDYGFDRGRVVDDPIITGQLDPNDPSLDITGDGGTLGCDTAMEAGGLCRDPAGSGGDPGNGSGGSSGSGGGGSSGDGGGGSGSGGGGGGGGTGPCGNNPPGTDCEVPMHRSNGGAFWNLPQDKNKLVSFLGAEKAAGGGDEPESGLVCLNEAMHSKWAQKGDPLASDPSKKISDVIPLIVIWTDANVLPPDDPFGKQHPDYPTNMPQTLTDLQAVWNNSTIIQEQKNKLIVFFGYPDNASPADASVRNPDPTPHWHWLESWQNFLVGGSLTDANNGGLVKRLVDAMAKQHSMPQLTK
jgi:hypothetical protein